MLNRHRNYFLGHLCRPNVHAHSNHNFRYWIHPRILQNHRNNPKMNQWKIQIQKSTHVSIFISLFFKILIAAPLKTSNYNSLSKSWEVLKETTSGSKNMMTISWSIWNHILKRPKSIVPIKSIKDRHQRNIDIKLL